MQRNTATSHLLNPEDITWTREVQPRERYRIVYLDTKGEKTVRAIELLRIGHLNSAPYLGVMHDGRFKTLRSDRVLDVQEQLTAGHACSIVTYTTTLPAFPNEQKTYRVPTIARSKRTWLVDLNVYTCTCPEKRIRSAKGYKPGQIGFVCPHMAAAILKQLPGDAADWTPELRAFLANPQNVAVEHLR